MPGLSDITDIEDDSYESDVDDNMLAANGAPIMSPSKILHLPALFDPPVPSSPAPLEEGSLDPLDISNNAIDNSTSSMNNSDPIRSASQRWG
jgi:hypothetical protein